MKPKNNLNWKM